ncbi:tRNA (adenine(58)-N(1))-methyltransferase TrmI [bacterium HR12]|nr:tRNA (adenine(58)-N(1))-methyltransferase TrmI [bacterium HR12]
MSRPFEPGERVLLIDRRGRHYLVRLERGGTWHSHGGALPHDLILGSPEGVTVHATGGMAFRCFRPRMADFVLKMPRGAQVVYPKDVGAILVEADVFPGARVLEAGTGSGSLTLALCRAVGPEGRVVSYELRPDFRATAARNLEAFLGKVPGWCELRQGDVREVAGTGERFDRVCLDLPEPWDVLPALEIALEPGGVLCAYLPTTPQIQELVLALPQHGFEHLETLELLRRSWHVTARSVRPDHRMVGHTGFLTLARRLVPQAGPTEVDGEDV